MTVSQLRQIFNELPDNLDEVSVGMMQEGLLDGSTHQLQSEVRDIAIVRSYKGGSVKGIPKGVVIIGREID